MNVNTHIQHGCNKKAKPGLYGPHPFIRTHLFERAHLENSKCKTLSPKCIEYDSKSFNVHVRNILFMNEPHQVQMIISIDIDVGMALHTTTNINI